MPTNLNISAYMKFFEPAACTTQEWAIHSSGRSAYHLRCCACSVRGGADPSAGSSHGKVRQNTRQVDVILKSGCQRAERVHGLGEAVRFNDGNSRRLYDIDRYAEFVQHTRSLSPPSLFRQLLFNLF